MTSSLRSGLTRSETIVVDRTRTIEFLGDAHRIYSTPSMVNDVEYACLRLIQSHIDRSQTSLGAHVSMSHLAATPLGEEVTISVRIESIEGRRVHLSATVADRLAIIGEGRHERVVVDLDRFRQRLQQRRSLQQ